MSDQRLRDLERRWRESASREDERVYLEARVRAGTLSRDRLELALALDADGAAGGPGSLGEWLGGLAFRRERRQLERAWQRVPLAMAHAFLPCAEALRAPRAYRAALAAAERAILRERRRPPGSERNALWLYLFQCERDRDARAPRAPQVAMARVLEFALVGITARGGGPDDAAETLEALAREALYPEAAAAEPRIDAAIEAVFPPGEGRLWTLRVAIRDEVRPWALGYRDPVRERVEARGEPEVSPEDDLP